ncbi:MAG: hypothetical protein J7L23_01775 [Candidatus Diapherotrites archaeon]|nr:hypothetical protein [Candidatus Diapherotrites archaeon]
MKRYYISICILLLSQLALSIGLTVQTPQNISYNTSSLTFQVDADENLTSMEYVLDNGTAVEMNSTDNLTWEANVNLGEGSHTVVFEANATNESVNETVSFTVDLTSPAVVLLSPGENTTANGSATLAYKVIDAYPKACYLYVNSSLIDENNSPQNNSNYTVTYAVNATGVYYWNVTCTDDANNSNVSETRSFNGVSSPSDDAPTVKINYPLNKAYQEVSELRFNVTDDNASLLSCSYKIDSRGWVNVSASNDTEITVYPSAVDDEGQHTLLVNCSDGALVGSSSVSFSVDTTPPSDLSITINDGDSTTTSREVTITLNAKGASQCAFSNDSSSWTDWSSVSLGDKSYVLPPGDGVKTIYYKCRDNTEPPNVSPTVSDSITLKLCGNGIIDEGEVCDGLNVTYGYYCSSDCKHKYYREQSYSTPQGDEANGADQPEQPEKYNITMNATVSSDKTVLGGMFNNSERVLNYSDGICHYIHFEVQLNGSSGGAMLTFLGSYTGSDNLSNLVIILKVPKSFAASSDDISVSTDGTVTVLEKDPAYAIQFSNITKDSSFSVIFDVNDGVNLTDVKEDLDSPEVLAEPAIATQDKQENVALPGEVTNNTSGNIEKRATLPATGLVLIGGVAVTVVALSLVMIVAIIAVYFYVKKRGRGLKLGPRVRL